MVERSVIVPCVKCGLAATAKTVIKLRGKRKSSSLLKIVERDGSTTTDNTLYPMNTVEKLRDLLESRESHVITEPAAKARRA